MSSRRRKSLNDQLPLILATILGMSLLAYLAWVQFLGTTKKAVDSLSTTAREVVEAVPPAAQEVAKSAEQVTRTIGKEVRATTDSVLRGVAPEQGTSTGPSTQGQGGSLVNQVVKAAKESVRIGADAADSLVGLSLDEEWLHGARMREAMLTEVRVIDDPAIRDRIARLAKPILARCERTAGRVYRFDVVEDPSFNAFAILGGNLFICKGVFDTGVSDAALQSIIAHEIAHVELQHCVKGSAVAIRAGEVAGGAAAGLASMLHEIVRLSYSIEQEFEADLFAYLAQRSLQLSKDQCLESLRLLARLTRPETPVDAPAPRPSTIMDELAAHVCTHPDTAERIRRLELEP